MSTEPGYPTEDCSKIAGEEKSEEENGCGDWNCNGPISPLPNFHVADVTGVHAKDARDGRERQEDNGDYREGVYEAFLPILLDVHFVTILGDNLLVS